MWKSAVWRTVFLSPEKRNAWSHASRSSPYQLVWESPGPLNWCGAVLHSIRKFDGHRMKASTVGPQVVRWHPKERTHTQGNPSIWSTTYLPRVSLPSDVTSGLSYLCHSHLLFKPHFMPRNKEDMLPCIPIKCWHSGRTGWMDGRVSQKLRVLWVPTSASGKVTDGNCSASAVLGVSN